MADLLVSVFQDKIEPPTALRADCPPELERIVLTAMSRDPALRPPSAEQMSRALDRLGGPRQEAAVNLRVLDEHPRSVRPTAEHRRRTADLRTLQDLGAELERRTRASRVQRRVAGRRRRRCAAADHSVLAPALDARDRDEPRSACTRAGARPRTCAKCSGRAAAGGSRNRITTHGLAGDGPWPALPMLNLPPTSRCDRANEPHARRPRAPLAARRRARP